MHTMTTIRTLVTSIVTIAAFVGAASPQAHAAGAQATFGACQAQYGSGVALHLANSPVGGNYPATIVNGKAIIPAAASGGVACSLR